jgi:transposase
MSKNKHYSAELKWKAVEMKMNGYSNQEIMNELGIKNKSQIKTWMSWHKRGETHRFDQPRGKQYAYGKGSGDLSELEIERLKNRSLETHLEILKKYNELERSWYQK